MNYGLKYKSSNLNSIKPTKGLLSHVQAMGYIWLPCTPPPHISTNLSFFGALGYTEHEIEC